MKETQLGKSGSLTPQQAKLAARDAVDATRTGILPDATVSKTTVNLGDPGTAGVLPSDETLKRLARPTSLSVPETRLTEEVALDWGTKDQMDPNVHTWKQTNRAKITEFAGAMAEKNGMSEAEGLYFEQVLQAMGNSVGRHHMSGSLKRMSYSPGDGTEANRAMIKFGTIDLFHYDYKPGVEYSENPGKIKYQGLNGRFGFQDLGVEDAESMPDVKSMAAKDRDSVLKVNTLAMAAQTHPGRIAWSKDNLGSGQRLRVYYEDMSKVEYMRQAPANIAELGVGDFALNPQEAALAEAYELTGQLSHQLDTIGYSNESLEMYPGVKGRVAGVFSPKGIQALRASSSWRAASHKLGDVRFDDDGVETILKARKKLGNVSDEELVRHGKRLDGAITAAEDTVQKFSAFSDKHPWVRTVQTNADPIDVSSEQMVEEANVTLERLKAQRKGMASSDVGQAPPESPAPKDIVD